MKCENCKEYYYEKHWCDQKDDYLNPDEERECKMFQLITNADNIRSMSEEELANEFVVAFTYMNGYRPETIFRSLHSGVYYDTREEAITAELGWLQECGRKQNL